MQDLWKSINNLPNKRFINRNMICLLIIIFKSPNNIEIRLIIIAPKTMNLEISYEIELANGNHISGELNCRVGD